jgi:hypothetical protein
MALLDYTEDKCFQTLCPSKKKGLGNGAISEEITNKKNTTKTVT